MFTELLAGQLKNLSNKISDNLDSFIYWFHKDALGVSDVVFTPIGVEIYFIIERDQDIEEFFVFIDRDDFNEWLVEVRNAQL